MFFDYPSSLLGMAIGGLLIALGYAIGLATSEVLERYRS